MNTCSWFFAALNGKAFLARFPCSKLMLETLVVTYQLAFLTPGSSPLSASSRKQTRHKPNLRYTECGRPQRWQRVYSRVENFCLRLHLTIIDVLATYILLT